jgi:small glutamine-rich tetratricopeptide repeat-containing protein alpha
MSNPAFAAQAQKMMSDPGALAGLMNNPDLAKMMGGMGGLGGAGGRP